MSVLQTIQNTSIPYASEGVIRTAQIDDTVAPEESVQLAVNVNFDQIGAIKTRPGVTQYATQITGPIKSFGKLNRNYIQDGYDNIKKFLGDNEFSSTARYVSISKINSEHFIVFWAGVSNDGFVQVVNVQAGSGVVTPIGTALEFDTANATYNACLPLDPAYPGYFINFWTGSGNDGFVQVFFVDDNYNVTAESTPLEFDTVEATEMAIAKIDSNHFICFHVNSAGNGVISNFEVNIGTYAVTEVGAPLTFESSTDTRHITCAAIGNGTHFLAFWRGGASAMKAQCFSVNTGTWNTTAIGTALTFSTQNSSSQKCISLGNGTHFVNAWSAFTGSENSLVQTFNVNPSTYAVTAVGTALDFDSGSTDRADDIANVSMGNGTHFTLFWERSSNSDGYTRVFQVNPSTYAITSSSNLLYFADKNGGNSAILIENYRILNFWNNSNSNPGNFVNAVFNTFGAPATTNLLYAQDGNSNILSWNGSAWTTQRTGLVTSTKARFSQYLGYIWMVNGGLATGNAVQTSNGGAFGTTLVPEGFPEGDFISAGFEGRVWVADSVQGVVYYSDIVQFTPPDNYSITYNPTVNFISNISPKTGQKITGLIEVPRALLLFTQDTITRIYGATSLDAYPAYNVGTYSQESIVETKTGIFFHHSSGFYQFDYGSQPIEISRRIIDFVQAIPRSYYDDITGVYDGFDAVEWSVGPVTVEGVTFSNCVLRYTISTQVWTIYDYVGNTITAMISYDNGTTINHIMGTSVGKVGAIDTGETDFGQPFYFEYIDRWRAFTPMYYMQKNIGSINVYSDNAGGANILYQTKKSGVNEWQSIGTLNEKANSIFPTTDIGDFDVLRFRIVGNTKGIPVIIHGIEIPELTIKGQDDN